MTVMADRTVRSGPERSRIKTLTQAALNADKTVEQVEDVLDSLGKTMVELNSSLTALNTTVERLEGGLDHLEGTLHSLDDLAKRLSEAAVGSGIYYPRLMHDYDCYRGHPLVGRDVTAYATQISSEVLSLPVHQHLTPGDIDTVVEAVSNALA